MIAIANTTIHIDTLVIGAPKNKKNIRIAIENYQEAQIEAIIEFERLIAKARGEIEFEGTSVGEDIAARDIERDIEFKEGQEERDIKKADELEFELEFFRLIREGRFLRNRRGWRSGIVDGKGVRSVGFVVGCMTRWSMGVLVRKILR